MPNDQWRPSADIDTLKIRATILAKIRQFFAERDVLEVETPALSQATVTDPNLQSIQTQGALYLQTSPEFHMKRLLAAGSGSIYQISKAFRNEESGRWHNLEFTLLEWYRIDFDHQQLMREVAELLTFILATPPAKYFTYAELFQRFLDIEPHAATAKTLATQAEKMGITVLGLDQQDKDAWLQLLLSHLIEPQLAKLTVPVFVYDFPASQAALARIRPGNSSVAERFEVYYQGLELANGFHELADPKEQRQRFLKDLAVRQQQHLPLIPLDENFLTALAHGFPDCAGIALGVDRLVMLAVGANSIEQVISFSSARA